ncbi:MAG: hypothetical protein EP329_23370 [Deltaproteobacteria bacterium]|nr:MAG: hypothetical protein EP329_23370 [Deltaproteobacteria bacterium]
MMHSHLDRAELISRLLGELAEPGPNDDPSCAHLLGPFARAVLRRVDDTYLFRHNMGTLGQQLRDSFCWATQVMTGRQVAVRAFTPTRETHGYRLDGGIIETLMPDQPFIFDTLKLFTEHWRVRVHNVLHIILPIKLAEDDTLEAIDSSAEGAENVSYTRWYVEWPNRRGAADVQAEVERRLTLARYMVDDFHRMNREAKAVANEFDYLATLDGAPEAACSEVRDFLAWLVRDNFVFMGVSYYAKRDDGFVVLPRRGLGSVRNDLLPAGDGTPSVLSFLAESPTLTSPLARIHKSSEDSVLHRRGKVDEIIVRTFDHEGHAIGGFVIHGMFTYKGLGEPGGTIPILRRKLQRVLDREGTVRSSYEHKAMVHAFNALPVEYLFEADDEAVKALIRMALNAADTHEIATHIATAPDGRSAYAFIVLPKENYSDDLRHLLQMVLQVELGATYADHRVHLGKFGSVALHFYLTGAPGFTDVDLTAIERKLEEVGTPWEMRLRRVLEAEFGAERGTQLYDAYADAFSEGYADLTDPQDALADIRHLENVLESGVRRFELLPNRASEAEALLRIYGTTDLLLTEILPIVDNFGVVVIEQYAFEVTPDHVSDRVTVNTLRVRRGDPDLLLQRDELLAALAVVFDRRMRSDRLNRVLLPGRLRWREVDVLRAYFQYARQLGSQLTLEIVQKTLIAHRSYVHTLARLFRTRFDPDIALPPAARASAVAAIERELLDALDAVSGFEEDRILRTFLNLVQATLRTNTYRRLERGEHYLSFKIACDRVTDMPSPRPLYEIYVHHARLEGTHLRSGAVARGGIRWSDRLDDYRSEVLGLLTTQVIKNAFIVPTGAKGGFVLTAPPEDPSEARRLADTLYGVYIRGLLDVTDNVVDGQIVPPARVLRYDDDDPYLVVAPDKGTAHLSNAANAVALERGFWLGDAFASGGSTGFDHRAMAIATRGAWVAVRRHLLEIGLDPDRDPVKVVGIGDMSGDVFGNGLLYSRTLRLIGAFNHRWVFIDPNPDPARSYDERARLFALPHSDWDDYDPAALSPGGGVHARGAKAIPLSREVRRRLGTELTEVSGEGLIRLILRADVDLMWSAGVGAYVKSSQESHADVGDAANDRVRVDADQLRCRVVGEPGNRGLTMRARIEFATRGGRVNTDAVDNAAGVDLSDHEVNLKVLLADAVKRGVLAAGAREQLLADASGAVRDQVLEDCARQSLAISLDELRSKSDIWAFFHAMMFLRERVGYSPRVTRMPRGAEVIEQRAQVDKGLVRPELAMLLSYAKMYAHAGLEEQRLGPAETLRPFVADYFPPEIVEACDAAIGDHLLFDRIAATVQTNRVVDVAGATLLPTLAIATERPAHELVAAALLCDELLDVGPLREAIAAAAEPMATDAGYRARIRLEDVVGRAARALLWGWEEALDLTCAEPLAPVREVAHLLGHELESVVPDAIRRSLREATGELVARGFDRGLSARLARASWLEHSVPVARIVMTTGALPRDVARAWFGLGTGSGILALVDAITRQSYQDRWDFLAVHSLLRSLTASLERMVRLRLADDVVAYPDGDAPPPVSFDRWVAERDLDAIAAQIRDMVRDRVPISAMLVVNERLKHRLAALDRAQGARA